MIVRSFCSITTIFFGILLITVLFFETVMAADITSSVIVTLTPAPPSGLSVSTISLSALNLTWTDNSSNEDGFSIERKTGVSGTYAEIATTSANIATYSDTGLTASTAYFYKVRAFNTDGYSAYSNEASSTTSAPSDGGSSGGGGGGGGGSGSSATAVIFQGKAYPGSDVTLLKDAQVVATVKAGPDANFQISLTGLFPGTYTFGVWAEDTKGNRSITHTFTLSITGGVTNTVSGIFLPPTIAIDKKEVKKGDVITIFGQSAPEAQVSIFINSEEEIIKKTPADTSGLWLYKFDTSEIDFGDHSTRARSAKDADISVYSNSLAFKVGSRNVLSDPVSRCPRKGDLNSDCRVNLVDFSVAAYWWKRPLTKKALTTIDTKLFPDGKIDLRDFSIMAYHWTG
ncbi:MAG: fibronectin type III domain-containing protein [Patescibacteria group bacterium]